MEQNAEILPPKNSVCVCVGDSDKATCVTKPREATLNMVLRKEPLSSYLMGRGL